MKSNKEAIAKRKNDANEAKHQLIEVQDSLYEIGAMKEAEQLGRIIEKLEIWQNK